MKNAYRRAIIGVAVVALGAAIAVLYYGFQLASIGTAYTAKILCSGIFVSHRDPQSLLGTDLAADDLSILRHIDARVDRDSRDVMATLFGLAKRKAVYREGRGCALVYREASRPAPRENGSPNRVRELDAATDELKLVGSLPAGIRKRGRESFNLHISRVR